MKLKEINKTEFFDFCKDNSTNNFFQTKEWAELKRKDGWHTYFVGLDQNGKIKAASMLLAKEIKLIKKRVFYAPRGFIMNYKDLELLRAFTKEIKDYVATKKGLFLKINPYLSINDDPDYDGMKYEEYLKSLGYIEISNNLVEPSTIYKISLDKDVDELVSDSVKEIITINKKQGVYIEEIKADEINKVEKLFNNENYICNNFTGDISDIYNIYKEQCDISIVRLDIDKYIESAQTEEELEKANKFQYMYGHTLILGCSISLKYGNEFIVISTIVNKHAEEFLSQYSLHYELIKKAKDNDYKAFCFYYIGKCLDNDDYYNNFNGTNTELVGEFDLVINKLLYKYFYLYCKRKNINIEKKI